MERDCVLIAGAPQKTTGSIVDLVRALAGEQRLGVKITCVAGDVSTALRALRPVGLLLLRPNPDLRLTLRDIAGYDRQLPVLLATGPDPRLLGMIDALAGLYRLRGLHRVTGRPTTAMLTCFLSRIGRRTGHPENGLGRLVPLAD